MKIAQSFLIPYPRDVVWGYFHDLQLVTTCIPGAELLSQEGDKFKGRMSVRVGPIHASFLGDGQVQWNEADRSGRLSGHASDDKTSSQARAVLNFGLSEADDNSTRVNIDVDVMLSGMMAQFGRGNILKDIAGRLIAEFSANLKSKIGAGAIQAAVAEQGRSQSHSQERQPVNEFNAGGLMWRLIVERFRRLFGFLTSRR